MKQKIDLGSLATHRAYLGLSPKRESIRPFPRNPAFVFAQQVKGLSLRLKAIGCKDVVIGLSGGLDSTLATLVTDAVFDRLKYDKKGIHLYTLPGFGTSGRTKGNATLLAEGLGLGLEEISIVRACEQHFKDIGHDGKTPDVVFENAQARMRTMILMDKANMVDGIVLGTADLSEIALGWCTFNGDHMAMFNVNNGVPKTMVRKVCHWWSENPDHPEGRPVEKAQQAVRDIIETPISPELVAGQVTEDKLGPYELHDFFLWNFIINEMGSRDLVANAKKMYRGVYDDALIEKTCATFMHRFFTQAFKRNCAPDGIRIFPFELSPHDWWIPSDLGPMKL